MTKRFPMKTIITATEQWLIDGELNADILAEDFEFISPFWCSTNKTQFVDQFQDPKAYQAASLSKIVRFEPVIRLTSWDNNYFAIILTYHTQNGQQVDEALLGTVVDGRLRRLKSIYDLAATKRALELN